MKLSFVILSSILFYFTSISFAQTPKKIKQQADLDFKLNKLEDAIAGYSKVLEIKPDDYDVIFNRAICYEKTNQTKNAINDYLSCNKLDYKEKDVYLKIADLYILLKDYKSANIILERLVNYDKWNIEGLRKSSWCHIIMKEFEQSVVKADRAINKDSNSEDTGTEILHYYRGIAKDSLGDYNAAILSYKRAISIIKGREVNRIKAKSEYKPYYVNIATALYKAKLFDESIKNYDIAILIDQPDTVKPNNYYIYYLKSFAFFAKADFNAAIGDLNRSIALNSKNSTLFYQRGIVYKQISQFQNAIGDFTKTISLDETNYLAYYYKAQCLIELGNLKEAIIDLQKYLIYNPTNQEALNLLKATNEKNYIANKENDPPFIKLEYPIVDQNNFANVYVNQLNALVEAQITDRSNIKKISVNGNEISFNEENLNPFLKYKISTENLKKIEISVTDIYDNVAIKIIKVGKIVSDTRTFVNLEGFIQSNDSESKPIENKNIFITNTKGEMFYSGKTSPKGYFKFENVPIDKDYLIELEDDTISLQNTGFKIVDKNGKFIMKSALSEKSKNKFNFELLKTELSSLSLMSIDDVALTINISGKLIAMGTSQFPLANVNFQIIKDNGEIIIKKTNENGYFIFSNLDPSENYSIKINEEDAKNITATKILITDVNGKVIKIIAKNELGFFEYKFLSIEKSQLSSITEPDPWLKINTLSIDKKELTIIENIYYESGSFEIPKVSEVILDKAVSALINNTKLVLEVESHTDAQASDEYNMELSQKRAGKVVEYIKSKTIDEKRLFPIGMGETKLINRCSNNVECSDEEHKQNRRTIFKLIYK